MSPGPLQIILIVAVIVLLFGANRLPRIMGDMAKGIRSFKSGLNEPPASVVDATLKSESDTSTVASTSSKGSSATSNTTSNATSKDQT